MEQWAADTELFELQAAGGMCLVSRPLFSSHPASGSEPVEKG